MKLLAKATKKSYLYILSTLLIGLICLPVNSAFAQMATSLEITGQENLFIAEDEMNPGWHFDSFFLGVELMNSMASLHISNVQESPLNGDIFAIGAGETNDGEYKGLLMRFRNGDWTVRDSFDIPNNAGNQILSIPMHIDNFGDVYFSDGYNLHVYGPNLSQNVVRTPDNSPLPEPGYENDRMVDIIQDGSGKMWLLYSYPRLVGLTGYNVQVFDIYDHTNSILPNPAESSHIVEEHPVRYLASTGDDVWITTYHEDGGLYRKTGEDWDHFTSENSDLPGNWVSAVVAQSESQLLVSAFPTEFGPANGGLMRFEDDVWTDIGGLPGDFARVHAVEEDKYIWASFGDSGDTGDNTRSGRLAEFDGSSWAIHAEEEEFYRQLNWLSVDSNNNKWLAGDFLVINAGVASLNQTFVQFSSVPADGSYINSGTDLNLNWQRGDRVENVSLSYSVDGGENWLIINSSIAPNQLPYQYTVSADHMEELELRIESDDYQWANDEAGIFTIVDENEPFYHIRRLLSDGTYELYDPVIHGWQMANSGSVMFPEEKWQDIIYDGPLEDWLEGVPSDFPSFNALIRAFGEDEAIQPFTTPFVNNIIPRFKAGVLWDILKGSGFQGVCHGFSVTSLIAFNDGNSALRNLGANISTQKLYDAEVDNDIREMINMIWVRQFSRDHFIQSFINALNENFILNLWNRIRSGEDITLEEILETDLIFAPPSQKLPEILAMLDTEASEKSYHSLTLFPEGNLAGGHSVVAYRAEQSEDNPDIWKIFIHDSNLADSESESYDIHEIYIEVDLEEDYYRHMFDSRFQGSIGMFLTDPADNYKTTSRLLKDLPEKDGRTLAEIESLEDIGFMYTLFGPDMDIRITDTMGHVSSLEERTTTYDIPGSFPIVPLVGGFHDPIGYFLADLEYEIELEYPADAEGKLHMFTGDTIYGYKNNNPEIGSIDQLRYGNSLSVYGADHTFDLDVTHANGTDQRMFSLRELTVSNGDSVNISLLNDSELEFRNYGEAISANLELRTYWDSEGYFLYEGLEIKGEAGYKIEVPVWEEIDTQEITVRIDSNLDGEYDDTRTLVSITTSVEEDRHPDTPDGFNLFQNYPNPFNPVTQIQYSVPQQTHVIVNVYNMLGQEVASLVDETKSAGKHDVSFDAFGLSSGVYIYRLQTESYSETRQMILVK